MSFMNDYDTSDQLSILKPEPKLVRSLDILTKAKSDLDRLENGKLAIEKYMVDAGINDTEANKKLERLNNSINRLKTLISDYETSNKDD
jgi:hypothetical protein